MNRPLILAAFLLTACGGTAQQVDAGVTARLRAEVPADADLVIDSLVVQVREVVFDAEGPDGSISLTEEQLLAADLSDGTFDDVVPIALTPGTYEDPYLGIELWDDGDDPALVLEGSLDDTPILFVFNSGEVFEAESDALVVAEGEIREVELSLDPAAWFDGVDASALELNGSGVAEISETSNATVFDEVADRLDETTDGRFPGGTTDDE